ncbi:MAG: glycosyltransferase family 4 protein [Acidobacteriota bacterium]
MRVAYVCADPGIPVFGRKGGSVHVQEVVRALTKKGDLVELFAARLGGPAPADLANVAANELPVGSAGDAGARERACLDANRRMASALSERGPFDVVYERQSLFGFAGMEYARDSGAIGLLEVNAPLVLEQETYRVLVDRAGAEESARRAFAAASAVLPVSRELVDLLESDPTLRGRVHEVPNGVDPDRFHPGLAPARAKKAGEFVVGFVGSLKPWHGLSVLAEAFELYSGRERGARLLVVGGGVGQETLESEISSHGLAEKTVFTGAVSPDEVPGWLASMDAAAAPYRALSDFYFSPLKLYEYMAAGLPVVASGIGQISEAIEDDRTGLLCPPGDASAFAAAFERLSRSTDLRARLGEAARKNVLRNHTWASVAERIRKIASGVGASPMMEALT